MKLATWARVWVMGIGAATNCTPDGCFAGPEEGKQQQHQADEEEDMHEIAHPI